MSKIHVSTILTMLIMSTTLIADDLSVSVDNIEDMFSEGSVSGQVRLGFFNRDAEQNSVATAIGGQLKYETASFNGFRAGAALYAAQSISPLSGDKSKNQFSTELTSSEKHYAELAEAYLNFSNGAFNFRGGRQLINTPLADSDDIRMTPNTHEAYLASYYFDEIGLTFMAGTILSWQGYDDGYENVLNNSWSDTGSNGTWLASAVYSKDNLDISVWYYDITKITKAFYTELFYSFELTSDTTLTLGAQYLSESESSDTTGVSSGVDGSISGVMAEFSYSSLTFGLAHNIVNISDGKEIFEGFGGGPSFAALDTMTAGTLHDGTQGDGYSTVASISYDLSGVNIFAMYGDFQADAVGVGSRAHVTELNLGLEYSYDKGLVDFTLFYVVGQDRESITNTSYDDDYVRFALNYNF